MEQLRDALHGGSFCSPIIDLRQYTLHPGTRDSFVELFDREFVETQEAAGMRILGQFRDLGDPNRFVWIRGFRDMPSRERALTTFYVHGDAWRAHGERARTMMIDSSDALLLHPAWQDAGFHLPDAAERPPLEAGIPEGLIVATLHHLPAPVDDAFLDFYREEVMPVLVDAGASVVAAFATEHSPNNFPPLPLRERENVFVLFNGFGDLDAYHRHMSAVGRHRRWRPEIYPALLSRLQRPPQTLRLAPTSRSQIRA